MNFEQLYESAKIGSHDVKKRDHVKIFVSSLMDDVGARDVWDRFQTEIGNLGIKANLIRTGSFGYYDLEPVVAIEKSGQSIIYYHNVNPETASELVNDYLIKDNPRTDLALSHTLDKPLFDLEKRIALRNCGHINPENIHHYIYLGNGYSGLSKALMMNREEVIGELKKSGLRGRGGAGFDTADKWRACFDAEASEKYVVGNAVDADLRSRTALLLLESDPHSVLEGMLIAAYAVGASQCTICVNKEYSFAVQRTRKALEQLKENGLTGQNILNSSFDCEIEILEVESSLVSGEETALISIMEEKQAMSQVRPPFPAVNGYKNRPTLIHNLETLANVSAVFQKGPEYVSGYGTEKSKGTKVITLSGDVVHPYTVEVEFGTTLLCIVKEIGGGVPEGKTLKAVQLGGPTGAYIAADSLDISLDYESVKEAGSMIGSGTIDLLSDDSCAVETCRDILSYIHTQSCGKCVFCREGTHQIADILTGISEQSGKPPDLDLLMELGEAMKIGCICGLGRTAPNPVLSSIRLFRDEFAFHIREKRCPVGENR